MVSGLGYGSTLYYLPLADKVCIGSCLLARSPSPFVASVVLAFPVGPTLRDPKG